MSDDQTWAMVLGVIAMTLLLTVGSCCQQDRQMRAEECKAALTKVEQLDPQSRIIVLQHCPSKQGP